MGSWAISWYVCLVNSRCAFPLPNNFWLRYHIISSSIHRHTISYIHLWPLLYTVLLWHHTYRSSPTPFIIDDVNSPNATTGRLNVQFGLKTLPADDKGKPIDPVKGGWVWLDGFSPFMPITTYFANLSLNLSNLPHYWVNSHTPLTLRTDHTMISSSDRVWPMR